MTLAVFQTTVQNANGDAIPSAQVTVRLGSSSGALASLFSNSAGTTPITNPFNANANGFARFFAAPGVYWISITGGGSTQVLERVVLAGDAASRNVLGTVSQSGGVPTGAIIERGLISGRGHYTKFFDGTLIQQFTRNADLSTTVATGSLFISTDRSWEMPISFSSDSYFFNAAASLGSSQRHIWSTNIGETAMSSTRAAWRYVSPNNVNRVGQVEVLTAIGRWY